MVVGIAPILPTPERVTALPKSFFLEKKMQNNLIKFEFKGNAIRTVERDGDVWFAAKDVCTVLDVANVSQALTRLDNDEKGIISNEGLIEQGLSNNAPGTAINIINESGLYSLILGSRKPEAKTFKKWVTSEVLPAIRKTGSYAVSTQQFKLPKNFSEALRLLADETEAREAVEQKLIEAAPAIEFHELAVGNTTDEFSVSHTAKMIIGGVGAAKILHAWLREEKLAMKIGNGIEPTALAIRKGYMVAKQTIGRDGRMYASAVFTPKGQTFVALAFGKRGDLFAI